MTNLSKCAYCKNKFDWNPKIILRILTSLGYQDDEFCSISCFIEYIVKKFKRKIRRLF